MAVIGWNSIGANSDGTTAGFDSQAYLNSSGLTYTATTGDTVTEFACYGDGTGTVEMAIYTVVGGVPSARVGSSSNVSIGSGANWYTTSTSIALTNGVEYTVALRYFVDESWNIRWSSIGTNQQSNGTTSPTPLPSTWSNNGTDTGRVSYYATVGSSEVNLTAISDALHAHAAESVQFPVTTTLRGVVRSGLQLA